MKEELTLEKEFDIRKKKHQAVIIRAALEIFEDDIYKDDLLKDNYANTSDSGAKKALRVATETVIRSLDEYEKLYELCWNKIKPLIKDNGIFS